ncbi:MAG: glycerate kinase [Parabacteroides merdae]
MGKVPSGILEEARKQNIPVIVLAGSIEDAAQMNRAGFQGIFAITPGPVIANGESDGTGICERKYPQAGDSDLFGNPPVRHALKQEKYVHGISTLRTIVGLH